MRGRTDDDRPRSRPAAKKRFGQNFLEPAWARKVVDAIAPQPGFTPAQYERLALIYTVASLRAGTWLIPGFHAAIDEGISDAHDDPQHFDLTAFDGALQALLASIATQG